MKKTNRREFVNIVVSSGGILTTVSLPAFLLQSCKSTGSNSGLREADPRDQRDVAGAKALAAGTSRVRGSAFDLTNKNNDKYAEAVRLLKTKMVNGKSWWELQAQIHQDFCPHGNWYFLPWHRAYLYYFEKVCMDVLNDPTFALPYWEWDVAGQNTLPPLARAGGKLEHKSRQLSGAPISATFVGAKAMQTVLAPNDFISFGSGRTRKPRGGQGASGPLESMPHNNTHVWVSGDMGTFMSPRDPVFWMHHCNIDRIWASWSQKQKLKGRSELPPRPGPGLDQTSTASWSREKMGNFYVTQKDSKGVAVSLAPAPTLAVSTLIDYEKAHGYTYAKLLVLKTGTGLSLDEAPEQTAATAAQNVQTAAGEMVPKYHVVLPLKLKGDPVIDSNGEKSVTFTIDVAGSSAIVNGSTVSATEVLARFAAAMVTTANNYAEQPGFKMYVDHVPVPRRPDDTQLQFYLNETSNQSAVLNSPNFLGAHGFFGHDHQHADHDNSQGLSLLFDLVDPLKSRNVVIGGEAKVTVYVKSPLQDLPADLGDSLKKMTIKIEYYDFADS